MGTRLGAGIPKALVEVAGATLVEHAVARSARATAGVPKSPLGRVSPAIVVVAPADRTADFERLLPEVIVVPGGAERTDSVAAGLAALPDDIDIVLVHDAARAFAPPELFDQVAAAVAAGADAAVPALPVTDTIKQVNAEGIVVATPDRSMLRAVQTPQGFTRAALQAAHAAGGAATDDATMVERCGGTVRVVDGDPAALKVTHPADLDVAARVAARAEADGGAAPDGPELADGARRPVLVVLAGLPGAGKTAVAHALAVDGRFAHVRIDTAHQALADAGALDSAQVAPYAVGMAAARDLLAGGLDVVADAVNPVAAARAGWDGVASQVGAAVLRIELLCSDPALHRERVEFRESDVPGLVKPTWAAVEQREYEPWADADLRFDTATTTAADIAAAIGRAAAHS